MSDPIELHFFNLKLKIAESLKDVFPAVSKRIYKGLAVNEFNSAMKPGDIGDEFRGLQAEVIRMYLREAGYDDKADNPYAEVLKLSGKSKFDSLFPKLDVN